MRRQAYGSWDTMLRESLVRAAVGRWLFARRRPLEDYLTDQAERGFVWLDELIESLGEYEGSRGTYADLDAFAPRLAQAWSSIGTSADARLKARESRRPRVISIVPSGDGDAVDPATRRIVVTFDRPMRTERYSVAYAERRDLFPRLTGFRYDAAGRVFTMDVRLEPDREYAFRLNSRGHHGFQAADGTPLSPVDVRFRTAASGQGFGLDGLSVDRLWIRSIP